MYEEELEMSIQTCLLIDREHGDLSTCAPRRNLGHFIKKSVEVGLCPMVLLQLENNTQMLGHLLECHDVLLDILGRAVVVLENGRGLVADNIPHLPGLDVEGEDSVHDGKDEDVDLVQDKATES